jgi:predicted ATPase/DNA-binding CsgD family transcriptional regulator
MHIVPQYAAPNAERSASDFYADARDLRAKLGDNAQAERRPDEVPMNSPVASGGQDTGRRQWQLPADVSGFVGRTAELARLTGLLGSARLVTVTGPGGVGKTRLALRAAADARFSDGTCVVELSDRTEQDLREDPDLLPGTVAGCLGRSDPGPGELPLVRTFDALLDRLGDRQLLVILDTCEHLAAACAEFAAAIVARTPGVSILATSRQPLHLPGEEVLRLGSLPVPATVGATLTADGTPRVSAGDAVELFAQRAAAAVTGFTVTQANLPDVIRLCRRLDGIPLAIELAAVRVRALPLAELADRLDGGIAAAIGTRRGTVSRHQTLHATIDWSYRLCSEAEQAVWRSLSVFAGSFDLAVARDVVSSAEVPADQVGAALGGLVDKSVALPVDPQEPVDQGEAGGRYRLSDAVREFGAQRLAEAAEDADCRGRHLGRYLELAGNFSRRLVTDSQQERVAQLRAEHVNIREALQYGLAAAPGHARDAAKLAAGLYPYWIMSGFLREGIHWQDRVLERFAEPSRERASALVNRALLGAALGRPDAGEQAAEATAMAARQGDERTQARGFLALQLALTLAERWPQALEAARQAQLRLEALDAGNALLTLDVQVAFTHVHRRDFTAVAQRCQRVLQRVGPDERWLRGNAHLLSALALYQQPGRQGECAAEAAAALLAAQDIGNLVGDAYPLEVFAWLAADAGRWRRAAWLLGAAAAVWERTGGRLSGSALLEGYHQRAVDLTSAALGAERYANAHTSGVDRPLSEVAALAIAGADELPDVPGHWAADADLPDDALTGREREIAELVASGLSNREIAARLVISKRTVDAHVNHIFVKLGLSSRVQLTIWLRDRTPAPSPAELSAVLNG